MTDLDRPLTVREFREFRAELEARFATKDDLKAFATKEDLKAFATKDDLHALRDELRTHFDIVAESLRAEFRSVIDWTRATTDGLSARVGALETGHGARLASLEMRVTRVESRRKKPH